MSLLPFLKKKGAKIFLFDKLNTFNLFIKIDKVINLKTI